MKNIFLRRILPIALCILMVLPVLAMNIFAANESSTGTPGDISIIGTELQNWAPMGQGYHSSTWNNDRHSKYLNNGTYSHSYQWWEPSAPERPNGAGVDPTKQYFGFTFNDGYYLMEDILIYAHSFAKGYNNIKYRIEALILGEWVEVGIGYQDDCVSAADKTSNSDIVKIPVSLSYYRCGVCDSPCGATWEKCEYVVSETKDDEGNVIKEYGGCGASKSNFVAQTFFKCTNAKCGASTKENTGSCALCGSAVEEKFDINTNNIRVWCSEYGYYAKRYGAYANQPATTHDWWLTPKVEEVEIMGYTGYRPIFDVPLNAYLVRNAALSGMIGADSSMNMYYPGLAGDEKLNTYWKAMSTGAQNIWADFNTEYDISKVGFSVGGCEDGDVGLTLEYTIKLLTSGTIEDGVWQAPPKFCDEMV